MLGFVTACSMTGWGGDTNGGTKFAVIPEGGEATRVLASSQIGFFDANGNVVSYSHSAKWRGEPDPRSVRDAIRAYQTTRDQADHGGFDPGYRGVGIAEPVRAKCVDHEDEATEKHTKVCYPGVLLTHETRDTNHDGYISGNIGTCGISSGIENGSGLPAAALFTDTVTCVNGHDVGADGFSTGTTEGTAGGARAFVEDVKKLDDDSEVGKGDHDNGLFDALPFDTRIQLLNSINTVSDVSSVKTRQGSVEVVTLRLTGVRVGNATYTPQGVTGTVTGMKNMKVDMKSPGAKLMLAWLADQAQAALDNGQTSLPASVTINDSVTISSDQLPKSHMKLATLDKSVVARLRALATAK